MTPKFRAWHKIEKYMMDVLNIDLEHETIGVYLLYEPGFYDSHGFDEIELMQWTGLQDKNGVDIYEGDILAYDFGGGVDCFIVERNPNDNQLQVRYLYMTGYNKDYMAYVPMGSSIIVGNQYENPELLEHKE